MAHRISFDQKRSDSSAVSPFETQKQESVTRATEGAFDNRNSPELSPRSLEGRVQDHRLKVGGLDQIAIDFINTELEALFSGQVSAISEQLSITKDINVSFNGFTLLHCCFYKMSWISKPINKSLMRIYLDPPNPEKNGQRLHALIQYLITNGANVEAVDGCGRTPIYFASTLVNEALNKQFWQLIGKSNVVVNPPNPSISPLHVMAKLSDKYLDDLVKMGANGYATDKFKRVPLHCAAMQNIDPKTSNITCLIYYFPGSTECMDIFGNYPLYYALAYGEEEVYQPILEHSSIRVINEVLKKIEAGDFPEGEREFDEFIQRCSINDEIYNVPYLKVFIGAGGKKDLKKDQAGKKLKEAKKSKAIEITHQGNTYYAHHDGHGFKHIVASKEAANRYIKNPRDLITDTRQGSALFFPNIIHQKNYATTVHECIEQWIKDGADDTKKHVKFKYPIGADNGNETDTVEIYFTGDLGSHIRPKYLGN